MKQRIGRWNEYDVILVKSKDETYWIISSGKKVHNRFNTAEDFGHWMYHSGFKPDGAIDAEKNQSEVEKSIIENKLGKAKLMLKVSGLSMAQISKFENVIKAKAGLIPVKKQVKGKKGTHEQTYYVRAGKKIPQSQMSLKTLTEEDIAKFKAKPDMHFLKLVDVPAKKWYRDTGLAKVGVDFEDAQQEAYLRAVKALASYKPERGGGAKLSTMINTFIYRKFQNMYKTALNRQKREQVDRFDTIDNTADILDVATEAEIYQVVENVIKKIDDNKAINNKDYRDLFQEWLNGYSLAEMAKKRNISRVMVAGKFKRVIYPYVREEGIDPPHKLTAETRRKYKFKKKNLQKAEGKKMTKGWAYLYKNMSEFLGEEMEIDVDDSHIIGERARKKLEILKVFIARIKDRREEKLLYRFIRNFDMFKLDFLTFAKGYTFKDINGKGENGYMITNTKIIIRDSDSLAVMQYNVILALLSIYVEYNDKIQKYIEDMDINVEMVKGFNKEFGYNVSNVVFNAFLYLLTNLDYKDNTMERYKKIQKTPDKDMEYIYHIIYEQE
jgi:RNA polymerase sigma factor (sigma-70 family)